MPRFKGLSSRKSCAQPASVDQHYNRGPSAASAAYSALQKRQQRAAQRNAQLSHVDGDEPAVSGVDVADALLSLSQQASAKLASSDLAAALSTDDRQLLKGAVHRILRPHQPAAVGQAGGLQRSDSGNKAVTDLLDVLRKLSQQLQQTKQEAEQKIEGLEKDAAEALDWWINADEMLKELQQEDAELKESIEVMADENTELKQQLIDTNRQLTREKNKPKLPQGRTEPIQAFVAQADALLCLTCAFLRSMLVLLSSDRRARRDRVRDSLEAFRNSNPGQSNLNAVLADMVLREKFVPLACADDL